MTSAQQPDARPGNAGPADGGLADAGPRPAADRRSRPHLRELCDEVLASFRLARERDVLSDGDRQEARTVLAQLTPSLAR